MTNRITNFIFLILLFLLQSCSGGRLGNFLESSFINNNVNQINQKDVVLTNQNNNKTVTKEKVFKNNKTLTKEKIISNKANENLITNKSNSKKITMEKLIKKNTNFSPKSYRIFVILNKVDPSSPTENFSKVLRDANINFEIEKIEKIPDLNKNLKINENQF
tara:strand:- start:1235 stop:1720 length:486 start_codon:yes stop_codon:yes gene_type:complete